jgi:hypothetical protein
MTMASKTKLRSAFNSVVTALSQLSVAGEPAPIPGRRAGVAAKAVRLAQPARWAGTPASSPSYDNAITALNDAAAGLGNAGGGLLAAIERADDALDDLDGVLG